MVSLPVAVVWFAAFTGVDLPRHAPGLPAKLYACTEPVLVLLANPQPVEDDPRRPNPTAADIEAVSKEANDLAKELDKRSEYLFNTLLAEDEKARLKAIEGLYKLGTRAMGSRMTETLLHVIQNDSNPEVRVKAMALIRDRDYPGVREAVLTLIADRNATIREAAVTYFWNDRARPDLAVPALAKALTISLAGEDTPANLQFRSRILSALSAYGHLAAEADSTLVKMLQARHPDDRRWAFATLVKVRKDKSTLVPLFKERFAKALDDLDRETALGSVHELGPLAGQFVPDIVRTLEYGVGTAKTKHPNTSVRAFNLSLQQLNALGPVAKAAAPDLLKFFMDREVPANKRMHLLSVYSQLATPDRDTLGQIAKELVTRELPLHNAQWLHPSVRRLSPGIMPLLAEEWKQRITDSNLSDDMLRLCGSVGAEAEPLLPMVESFFVEKEPNNRPIPSAAVGHDASARWAARKIKADVERRKKAAPPKK